MSPYAGILREFLHGARELTYLRPTAPLRKVLLLSELDREPQSSQRTLAKRAGVSLSVADAYLARFIDDGLVTKTSLNRRDCAYALSERGRKHLSKELLRYLREVFFLSTNARTEISTHIEGLFLDEGPIQIAVYPAGGVGESVTHALESSRIEVKALVDDDPQRQGLLLHGLEVLAPEALKGVPVDAVLVATYIYREEILDRLRTLQLDGVEVVCL